MSDNFYGLTSEEKADVYSLYYQNPISFEETCSIYLRNEKNIDKTQKAIENFIVERAR